MLSPIAVQKNPFSGDSNARSPVGSVRGDAKPFSAAPAVDRVAHRNWRKVLVRKMSDLKEEAKSNLTTLAGLLTAFIAVVSIAVAITTAIVKDTGNADGRYAQLSQKVSAMEIQIAGLDQSIARQRAHSDAEDSILSSINNAVIRLGQKFDDRMPARASQPKQ